MEPFSTAARPAFNNAGPSDLGGQNATAPARSRVLCVDDEPNVLEGLSLHLRRRYEVVTATSGAGGLEILRSGREVAVIISDMRMPGMNGAVFLREARNLFPDTTRILLTGHADLDAAVSAVNEGQIFRFLSKPCPPPTLMAAVEAGETLHRVSSAERILLEQTLHGSIKLLTDILALTSPLAFGRGTRIKQLVSDIGDQLSIRDRWQHELAAMLSQIGSITLPADLVEKMHFGKPLNEREQKMVSRMPEVTKQLLGNIPRLEVVTGMLATIGRRYASSTGIVPGSREDMIATGAQMLRVAMDFDDLESSGESAAMAISTMRGRADTYNPTILDALAKARGGSRVHDDVRELPLAGLKVGMVFADDVKLANGTLLVTRGYEITPSFIERVHNFRPGTVREPVRVVVPPNVRAA